MVEMGQKYVKVKDLMIELLKFRYTLPFGIQKLRNLHCLSVYIKQFYYNWVREIDCCLVFILTV